MAFSDQIRYNKLFQKVIHMGRESEIKCFKIFQNDKALEISVINSFSEDQLMHTFLEHFNQGGKYSTQI